MILESKGKIAEQLYAIGNPALPAFLWTGKTACLFDAGMTFMGPAYFKDIQDFLRDARRLGYLFITHSHFDHCGSAPYLRRKIPGLRIGASVRAADVWKRPNAIQMIQNLSKGAEEAFQSLIGGENVLFDGLEVDLTLDDGAEIDLGEAARVQVLATPGHTRDAVSYYLPGIKALICGEAVATLNRDGSVRPQFLASDQDYLSSLEKMSRLMVEILIMAHLNILTGEDVQKHLSRSIQATMEFRRRIEKELAAANGNQQAVIEKISREDYEEKKIILQEKRPYLINLT
ncbi:MAG: beta-lactamase domain protein, partial [Deltaproteobacteria bacterium]|nr:beta-lactamase domain protein [Deltaproteobacteria bacterium]